MEWLREHWPLLLKIAVAVAVGIFLVMLGIYLWENRIAVGIMLGILIVVWGLFHDQRQRGEVVAVFGTDVPGLLIVLVLLVVGWKHLQGEFPRLKPEAQREREAQAASKAEFDQMIFEMDRTSGR